MVRQDPVAEWMRSLGFELTFDTGLKAYYNKKMGRVINAEAVDFFYQQMLATQVQTSIEIHDGLRSLFTGRRPDMKQLDEYMDSVVIMKQSLQAQKERKV